MVPFIPKALFISPAQGRYSVVSRQFAEWERCVYNDILQYNPGWVKKTPSCSPSVPRRLLAIFYVMEILKIFKNIPFKLHVQSTRLQAEVGPNARGCGSTRGVAVGGGRD